MARAETPGPTSAPKPDGWRLRATLAWLACLAASALALELAVLIVDIGPVNPASVGTVVAFALLAGGAAVAFWRLVARRGNRPRLAAALLMIAVVWAGLGAWTVAWLFGEFNS